MTKTKGVLYIASGKKYVDEAKSSAQSLRRQMPDIQITIATSDNVDSDLFNNVIDYESEYPDIGKSIITPELMAYDKTLFLDTDTYIAKPIDELFEILEDYDMCFARGNGSISLPKPYDAWKEFNTGVVGFRTNDKVASFLKKWGENYDKLLEETKITRDQPAFGVSIFESDLRYFVLPRRYNCRLPRGGYVGDDIKIGHGRLDGFNLDLKHAVEQLNQRNGTRIFTIKRTWNLDKTMAVYGQQESLYRSHPRMFLQSAKRRFLRATRAAKDKFVSKIK